MRPAARAIAGFTLLEVMVVLAIGAIAYVMILGVPMRGASIYDLKSAARTLASGLRQAQTVAMATRRDALLTIARKPSSRSSAVAPTIASGRGSAQSATSTLTSHPALARSHNQPPADCTTSAVLAPTTVS